MEIYVFRSELLQIIKILLISSSLVVVCVDFESAKRLICKKCILRRKTHKSEENNHCCHLFIVPTVSWPPDVKK